MILYHGTTRRRARRICLEGFLPRRPSSRVWFAESRSYAIGRAKTQARRSRGRPCVLRCDINLAELRKRLGKNKVLHRNSVIAIGGPVLGWGSRRLGERSLASSITRATSVRCQALMMGG